MVHPALDLVSPPLIKDLVAKHKAQVDQILFALKNDVKGDEDVIVDELFALRFLLSIRKLDVAEATKNARDTLAWRNANREKLAAAAKGDLPNDAAFNLFVKSGYAGTLGGLHPVFIVRAGLGSTRDLMNALSHDQVVEYLLMQNERAFRMTDGTSRETGRLCKLVTIIDLAEMSLFKFDRRFPKAQGASSHMSAVFYPQLLGKSVAINAPTFFKMMFGIFSLFMSPAAVEKFSMCPAQNTKEKSATACLFLAKFGANGPASVPDFLGGTFSTPDRLKLT